MKFMIKSMLVAVVSGLLGVLALSPALAAEPFGTWLVKQEDANRTAHVKVSKCGKTLCNEIIWLSQPIDERGRQLTDARNVNPRLRNRPIMGLTVLLGMRLSRDGKWHGKVYSPERGQVYKGHVTVLSANKLKITGCQTVLFVPVCESRFWTRVQ